MAKETTSDGAKPLKNARHERFAQAIADGSTGVQAYRNHVSDGCTTKAAMESASRLLADAKVSSRVGYLQNLSAQTLEARWKWDKEKALGYLIEILETPIGEVDRSHRLAQELRTTEDGETIKLPPKADAMKQLVSMLGWNAPDKVEHTADERLLSALKQIRGVTHGG